MAFRTRRQRDKRRLTGLLKNLLLDHCITHIQHLCPCLSNQRFQTRIVKTSHRYHHPIRSIPGCVDPFSNPYPESVYPNLIIILGRVTRVTIDRQTRRVGERCHVSNGRHFIPTPNRHNQPRWKTAGSTGNRHVRRLCVRIHRDTATGRIPRHQSSPIDILTARDTSVVAGSRVARMQREMRSVIGSLWNRLARNGGRELDRAVHPVAAR